MSEDINKAIAEVLASSPDGLTDIAIFAELIERRLADLDDAPMVETMLEALTIDGMISEPKYQITQKGRARFCEADSTQPGA